MTEYFINLFTTETERQLITKIVDRAMSLGIKKSHMDIETDITATHCNGNPLRLEELLAADNFDFINDIGGIHRHLNRSTGKLENGFIPRFSK